jgi:hypothetical protein
VVDGMAPLAAGAVAGSARAGAVPAGTPASASAEHTPAEASAPEISLPLPRIQSAPVAAVERFAGHVTDPLVVT